MVADPTSAARLLGRRQHSERLGCTGGLELAGHDSARYRVHIGAPAPGALAAGNRFAAPHGACDVDGDSMLLLLAQYTGDEIAREAQRLQRNYEYLSYGLTVAWIVLVVYVLFMAARQKKL